MKSKIVRFSVPNNDKGVLLWLLNQSSLSMSLRMLIGDTIERHGYVDYACRERAFSSDLESVQDIEIPVKRKVRTKKKETSVPILEETDVVSQKPVEQKIAKSEKTELVVQAVSDDDIAHVFSQEKPADTNMSDAKPAESNSSEVSDDDIFKMFNV